MILLRPEDKPDEAWMQAASDRLGANNLKRRLDYEVYLRRSVTPHLQARLFGAVLPALMKLCGLHKRGLRNLLDIRTVRQEWHIENLPAAFDGFRLVQLSDLHFDIHPDMAEAVCRAVRSVSGDYDHCVLTGDYRDRHRPDSTVAQIIEPTLRLLENIETPAHAIPGNHDPLSEVYHLEKHGLPFLLNEAVALERSGEMLWLAGVDDSSVFKTHDTARALATVPADGCVVLLNHAPIDLPDDRRVGLMLSGHTHGGQVCLPGGYPPITHAPDRSLTSGRWQKGALQGYTARGTGGCSAPYRFNCQAEITLHTLRRVCQ